MMNRRVPFQKPMTQNSFTKSDRNYPQGKTMDFSPMKEQKNLTPIKNVVHPNQLAIVVANGGSERFHFLKGTPSRVDPNDDTSPIDNTLLWVRNIGVIWPSQKKKQLAFRQCSYVVSGYSGTGFPSVIYLSVDSFPGLIDSLGVVTTRVVALQLDQMLPMLDDVQNKTYDLRYTLRQSISWDIPPTITVLRFRLKFDDNTQYVTLPLINPITINFEIKHIQ